MESSLVRGAIISGICFGAWPLMMNRGGLSGNIMALVFVTITMICISPFAIGSIAELNNAKWPFVISAGIIGAAGMLLFIGMLTKAKPENTGSLFIIMIIVQTCIPVIYQLVADGGVTTTKATGLTFAIVAAVLLNL